MLGYIPPESVLDIATGYAAKAYATKAEQCRNTGIIQGIIMGCTDAEKGFPDLKGRTLTEATTHEVLPATDPSNKSSVCGKSCGFFDVFCLGAKVQAGCGGGGCWFGLPDFGLGQMGCWAIPGVIALIVILILLKKIF